MSFTDSESASLEHAIEATTSTNKAEKSVNVRLCEFSMNPLYRRSRLGGID
jgi:hypothetical protein